MNLSDVRPGQRVRVRTSGNVLATVLGVMDMADYEVAVHADGALSDWPVHADEIEPAD